jgi:type II secretory pathway component GspD/PulD (secretin)
MLARYPLAAAALAAGFLALLSPPARAGATEKLETRTYQVADLIVPLTHKVVQGPWSPGPRPEPQANAATSPAARQADAPEKGSPSQTQGDRLIQMIVRAVEPASWQLNGGAGTVDYYPLAMSLVITQRPQVHERIAALLADLRKAQNTEVALEVRFLTVSEGFLERVGLNLDRKESPVRVTPGTGSSGSELAGVETENHTTANPDPIFLDAKQVKQLMEMVQGDARSNVMQAPKVTLANGQTAAMNLTDTHYFVTGVDVVRSGDQTTVRPKNEPTTTGFRMTAQPVVSADRRYVQLFLKIDQTDLASPVVPVMPVPVEAGKGKAPLTQYVQQPSLTTLSLEKTATIPDGGTVVFGGLHRVAEVRNENGPPVLSKIPYINRCFRNVGYGRESVVMLVLATPRIVVNEEEEAKAVLTAVEEQDEPASAALSGRQTKVLADLLRAYDQACAEGRTAEAHKYARAALAIDPACFGKKR